MNTSNGYAPDPIKPDTILRGPPSNPSGSEVHPGAALVIGQILGQAVVELVSQEIVEYSERNRIPAGEITTHITKFKNDPRLVAVELVHQKDAIPILGSPRRSFKLEVTMKVKS